MDIISPSIHTEVDDDQNQQRGAPDMDRIRNARKRRIMQLKRWTQYDKAKEKEEISRYKKGFPSSRKGPKSVRFSQNLILLEAGNHGDTEEVRRLLSDGVCADVANSDGLSALHQCAINKNIDMCRVLINYSANVNAKDKELWTPLHASAICGHTEICLLLIRSGADLLAINSDGNMPYDICEDEITLDAIENEMAARGITQEMINEARMIPERTMMRDLQSVVTRHGPTYAVQIFSQLDKQGANCMHVAAACGYGEVAKYLVSLSMPLDLLDRDGWQAIHVAAVSNQLEIIEILVSHGANIDAQNKQGETVYELVYDKEMYDKLMLLKREMEKLNDSKGVISSVGLVRRRSSTNPRSASIRRTSMKEKSLMSWKEARLEAELRMSAEGGDNGSGSVSVVAGNHHQMQDDYARSSGRGKHKSVPETIAEVECNDQESADVSGVALDLGNSDDGDCDSDNEDDNRIDKAATTLRPWPLPGLANKDLRGSFTHPHPYNSPTRDPDTFPYSPGPAQHSQPSQSSQAQNLHKNGALPANSTIRNGPEPKPRLTLRNQHNQPPPPLRSSQEPLDGRPLSVRASTNHGGSIVHPRTAGVTTSTPPSKPTANTMNSTLQRASVASVKSSSAHTTPIGSTKSASQLSLYRTPPPLSYQQSLTQRDDQNRKKQISKRYNKPPRPDNCCLIM